MYRFLELIVRYREYAATVALTIISLTMISASDNERIRSFRTISVGIVAAVQEAFDWVPNPWDLEAENRALRQLNRDLSLQAMELRDGAVKAEKYKEMLEFREASPMKLLSAEVNGMPTIQGRNYAVINVGAKQGVKEGMPVMTPSGLVGRIIGVNDAYSIVLLLTNPDSRVAARTLRSRQAGIVVWSKENELLLQNVRAVVNQPIGDTVLTSGLSALYPEDIPIGTIKKVEEEGGTLYYRIVVEPLAQFSTLEEVFVVLFAPEPQRLEIEQQLRRQLEEREAN